MSGRAPAMAPIRRYARLLSFHGGRGGEKRTIPIRTIDQFDIGSAVIADFEFLFQNAAIRIVLQGRAPAAPGHGLCVGKVHGDMPSSVPVGDN